MPDPRRSPQVAIAIVSWNTRELLRQALESLRPDADSGLAEVWVVDNASTDGSDSLVRQGYPWVRLITSATNLGYGPAVNLVARRTTTPWIAAANADVALAPEALLVLLRAAARAPGTGLVAPRLVRPDGSTQHSVHPFPTLKVTLAFNLGLGHALPGAGERLLLHGKWDPTRPRRVDWAHGAFFLVRRVAFEEVGGFDDAQWLYAEDLDLCWRLARAGWSTRYEPQATVRHAVSAATQGTSWAHEREIRAQACAYAWMERRFGRVRTRLIATVNFVGAAIRMAPLWVAARRDPERFAAVRDRHRAYLRMHATGLVRANSV